MLIDISKMQYDKVGDGTTSMCVVTGALFRGADKILNPQLLLHTIIVSLG